MTDNMLKCTLCPFATINDRVLTSHYVRIHRFHERFYVMCNVNNCGATYKRWKSYKMHVYRKHKGNISFQMAERNPDGEEATLFNFHSDDEEMPLKEVTAGMNVLF